MKKRSKFKPRKYARPPRQRVDTVLALARQGLSGDVIAATVGVNKNSLRAEHASDLHAGREIRAAEQAAADAAAITKEEYHFLNAATSSFDSDWFDPQHGNALFFGMDGKGARDIDDAFRAWKAEGGKFITSGLSNNFDPQKYAEFVKIVERYRQGLKSHEE
jgi:hypothetical protein